MRHQASASGLGLSVEEAMRTLSTQTRLARLGLLHLRDKPEELQRRLG
jgi:hypothetical protein